MFIDAPTVKDLLGDPPAPVVTIEPDAEVRAAARTLIDHRIGILVVVDADKKLLGLLSERDIVRAVSERGARPVAERTVREIMSTQPIACGPDDFLNDVLVEMKTRAIRHMPVLDDERCLLALISLGDVLMFLKNNTTMLTEEIMWSHALTHI